MRENPSNVNSRVNAIRVRRKRQFVPSILPKGTTKFNLRSLVLQDMQPLPVGIKSTPPRALTYTHALAWCAQLPTTAGPALSSHRQQPTSPPMPARTRQEVFFQIFYFLSLPPLPLPRRDTDNRGRKKKEGGIDTSAGLGGAWPTEPYFPKQVSEGCHPTDACLRATVSSPSTSVCAVLLSNSLSRRSLFRWGLLVVHSTHFGTG